MRSRGDCGLCCSLLYAHAGPARAGRACYISTCILADSCTCEYTGQFHARSAGAGWSDEMMPQRSSGEAW